MNSVPALATGLATVAAVLTGPAATTAAAAENREHIFTLESRVDDPRACADQASLEKQFPKRRFWCAETIYTRPGGEQVINFQLKMAVVGEWQESSSYTYSSQCQAARGRLDLPLYFSRCDKRGREETVLVVFSTPD